MKRIQIVQSFSLLMTFLFFSAALGADAPRVGRAAAAKYFDRGPAADGGGSRDHYLALHLGKYMSSQAWDWGLHGRENSVGNGSFGVTYRMDEWSGTMDFALRIDYLTYEAAGETPSKLSLMPVILFPDANSRFPLYFGAGIGGGVFFKQIADESPISFDYQLIMGARFFDLFENVGFLIETGMKNHLLLTSSGQFNGLFLSAGAVFSF